MGIPYYFYSVYKKYAKENVVLRQEELLANKNIHHLFFDYNSLIHPCSQQVLSTLDDDEPLSKEALEMRVIEACIVYTRYIIDILQPVNAYIMIDGVAPRAKVNQQRERRYKSRFFKLMDTNQPTTTASAWDSNCITPGTGFMRTLKQELLAFAADMSKICDVHISGADEPGEGEHKMTKYIATHLGSESERICIYGLDADLIMLSMMSIASNNIVLMRDNTFNDKAKESERTWTYLDIAKLKHSICSELKGHIRQHPSATRVSDEQLVSDYIFLCFLLGNDFLEHIPSLVIKQNGVGVLVRTYVRALMTHRSPLVDTAKPLGAQINMAFLQSVIQLIAHEEQAFFANYDNHRIHYKDKPIDDLSPEAAQALLFFKDDVLQYKSKGYKNRYYLYYGVKSVHDACRDYFEGLEWVLGYYNLHQHDNWLWFYRHHATPFASDLLYYLQQNSAQHTRYISESPSLRPSRHLSVLEQLYLVLPRDSLLPVLEVEFPHLATKMRRLFQVPSPVMERLFPTRISLDLIHKEYLWQSKVFFHAISNDFQILHLFH